ncbi:hypothetical protein [Pontibacter ruber]|uniref:Uncharacterized protein n=1 Tax=Pontibacter ruber TaxID=1343895 RepID=A0ABW5CXM4_9BACT|nr:hypothetical protein [Pontibacter ruber]
MKSISALLLTSFFTWIISVADYTPGLMAAFLQSTGVELAPEQLTTQERRIARIISGNIGIQQEGLRQTDNNQETDNSDCCRILNDIKLAVTKPLHKACSLAKL